MTSSTDAAYAAPASARLLLATFPVRTVSSPFRNAGFWALIAMAAVLGGTLRCP